MCEVVLSAAYSLSWYVDEVIDCVYEECHERGLDPDVAERLAGLVLDALCERLPYGEVRAAEVRVGDVLVDARVYYIAGSCSPSWQVDDVDTDNLEVRVEEWLREQLDPLSWIYEAEFELPSLDIDGLLDAAEASGLDVTELDVRHYVRDGATSSHSPLESWLHGFASELAEYLQECSGV